MQAPVDPPQTIRFGPYEARLRTGELYRKGVKLSLQEKPFQILAALLSRPGQLVTREEFRQKLWSADTFVDFDNGLNTAIAKLRETLGDSADDPRYIETLAKRGYRLVAPVRAASSTRRVMLVVLPFENLSGDPEQEYFSDGLTEEMIAEVTQLSPERLGVIARTSAMQYKKTAKRVDKIARELGVDYILEGSVRRGDSRVRITAQLIWAPDQTHLWARSYDRDLQNILDVQREVAQEIATEIQLQLTPQEQMNLARPRPIHPEAYDACLRGRFHVAKFSREGLEKGIDYLSQAILLDPDYALAHDGMVHYYLFANEWLLSPRESMPKAKEAAKKALQIDDSLADAHASLGMVHFWYDWDWSAAEKEFKRAIDLNPGLASAHELYGWYLAAMGRSALALATEKRALELNPLSAEVNAILGHILYLARNYDQAIEQLHESLDIDPNYWFGHLLLGLALQRKGEHAQAIAEFERARVIENAIPETLAALGYGFAVLGERSEAEALLRELKELSERRYVPTYLIAKVFAGLGEKGEALTWLEKAYQDRSVFVAWLKVEPEMDALRSEPRFQVLLRRLAFPS